MRPTYETQSDRNWQTQAKQKIESKLFMLYGDSTVIEEGPFSKHDFTIIANGCEAIGEYKRRTHKFGTYPDVTLSESKWNYLRKYRGSAFIVFEFTDGVYLGNVSIMPSLTAKLGGRTLKTRDPFDIHMCVQIPIEYLVPLRLWVPEFIQQTGQ